MVPIVHSYYSVEFIHGFRLAGFPNQLFLTAGFSKVWPLGPAYFLRMRTDVAFHGPPCV